MSNLFINAWKAERLTFASAKVSDKSSVRELLHLNAEVA